MERLCGTTREYIGRVRASGTDGGEEKTGQRREVEAEKRPWR
jgi:hypothetical protein